MAGVCLHVNKCKYGSPNTGGKYKCINCSNVWNSGKKIEHIELKDEGKGDVCSWVNKNDWN